jgi:hypothetical protein
MMLVLSRLLAPSGARRFRLEPIWFDCKPLPPESLIHIQSPLSQGSRVAQWRLESCDYAASRSTKQVSFQCSTWVRNLASQGSAAARASSAAAWSTALKPVMHAPERAAGSEVLAGEAGAQPSSSACSLGGNPAAAYARRLKALAARGSGWRGCPAR